LFDPTQYSDTLSIYPVKNIANDRPSLSAFDRLFSKDPVFIGLGYNTK
jgi:hypothetical protein